jgi:hypothetical protein
VVLSGYSAFSTTKTGRHDKAEILLKVVLNTNIVFSSLQITIPEEARVYIIIKNAASTKVVI